MKKGSGLLIVGAILIIAAIGVYAITATNIGLEVKQIGPHEEKIINYNLTEGNYTLIIKTSGAIHYSLYNSTSVLAQGNTSNDVAKNLEIYTGTYNLKIENLSNKTVAIAFGLKSQESLMSLGLQVLGSGGICLTGIIILIVGVWLILREKRKGETNVH